MVAAGVEVSFVLGAVPPLGLKCPNLAGTLCWVSGRLRGSRKVRRVSALSCSSARAVRSGGEFLIMAIMPSRNHRAPHKPTTKLWITQTDD